MPAPAFTAEAAPTLTIRPSPAAIMWGVAALQAVAQVLTFMANILSHSPRSPSCSVCQAKPPAMLTRASRRPVRALLSAIAAEVASRSVRLPPASVKRVHRRAEQMLAAVGVDTHIVPLGLEPLHRGQGQAHRPAAPGDPHLGVVLRRRRLGLTARAAPGLPQRLALAAGALAIFGASAPRALDRIDPLRGLR